MSWRLAKSFLVGAVVGILGGLIGLGGAEFRLPLLIGVFEFGPLAAVILNKAMSLVVVTAAIPARVSAVPIADVLSQWPIILNLLSGSIIGAWAGASWAVRLKTRTFYLVIAALLLLMAFALLLGHVSGSSGVPAMSGLALPRMRPSVFPLVRLDPVFWLLLLSYGCFAFFYSSLLFSLLPLLGESGMSAIAAVGLFTLIGPSQVAGRLGMFAVGRLIPIGAAGALATTLPVLGMLVLIGVSSSSSLFLAFPLLFGAGMGIKTIVQATAAPEFLGISEYGALQGLLATPAQIVQAASPFIAALLWQWTGNYDALKLVLLVCASVSALAFGFAAWLSRRRELGHQ